MTAIVADSVSISSKTPTVRGRRGLSVGEGAPGRTGALAVSRVARGNLRMGGWLLDGALSVWRAGDQRAVYHAGLEHMKYANWGEMLIP